MKNNSRLNDTHLFTMKTNLLIFVLLLGGCTILNAQSPRKELRKERKQNRYERKAEHFRVKAGLPECVDTIVSATITIPKEVHDTTIKVVNSEPIVYETERVKVVYSHSHTDSITRIQAECKEAKVIHTIETIKETKTEYKYPPWVESVTGVLRYWWVLGVIAFILTTIGILKKFKVW